MINPVVQLHTADALLLKNTKTLIFIISEFLNIQVLKNFANYSSVFLGNGLIEHPHPRSARNPIFLQACRQGCISSF